MTNETTVSASDAARALGSIKTARKSKSSAQNVKRAHDARSAQRKKLSDIPCTCSGGDSTTRTDHAGTCARYHAIRYREMRGLPME
jgi:hypothetical protein